MKKDLWKLIILVAIGILPCHIEILGCYPFILAYFTAVFMEDFYRSAFVAFEFLWMAAWLPLAQLGKYGIAALVTMVAIVFAERLYRTSRKMYGAGVSALALLMVSMGGITFEVWTSRGYLVLAFEILMTFSLALLVNREVGVLIAFHKKSVESQQAIEMAADWHLDDYAKAFEGLSETFTKLSQKREGISTEQMSAVQQELQMKVCASCGRLALCQETNQKMSTLLQNLWDAFAREGYVDEDTKKMVEERCARGEEFIRETLQIFDRIHLNISWYNRLVENREMIAGQLDAMSYAMGNCISKEECVDDSYKGTLLRLVYRLREYGISGKKPHIYQRENKTLKITISLKSRWGNCVPIRDAIEVMEREMGSSFVSATKNRNLIGREQFVYEFVSSPKLKVSHGVARLVQEKQELSGDSYSFLTLEDGRVMAALSDGMGSGYEASKESETVMELMEQFMRAGFSVPVALRLMNASMVFGSKEGRYSTLDLCLLDSYTGIVEFYKVGAHVSYIRHTDSVEIIAEEHLPVGAELSVDTTPWRSHAQAGDFLVMVTDGVLEYLQVYNPTETVRDIISCIETKDPEQFAMRLLERILLYTGGRIKDDMTVLVVRIQER